MRTRDEEPFRSGRDRPPERGPRLGEPLPLTGVLDNLRSAFNVGAIFRTAEAARLSGLHLCGITPYPPHRELDRTALGTALHVPWEHHVETGAALDRLRAAGQTIWAVELDPRAESLRTLEAPPGLALVFGHETLGVSPAVLERADRVVALPLHGRKNSLNVATTFGIVIFEVLRQWGY